MLRHSSVRPKCESTCEGMGSVAVDRVRAPEQPDAGRVSNVSDRRRYVVGRTDNRMSCILSTASSSSTGSTARAGGEATSGRPSPTG